MHMILNHALLVFGGAVVVTLVWYLAAVAWDAWRDDDLP